MIVGSTLAQWQSVVAAVDPRHYLTMVYNVSGDTGTAQFAGIVELGLVFGFANPLPPEADFLAAFPDAIKVGVVGAT